MLKEDLQKITNWTLPAAMLICVAGWFALVPDGIPGQIAAIAAETIKNPHAADRAGISEPLIWLSVSAMRILGQNGVALHIPGFLAILVALFCTYRFTYNHFGKETGLLATVIFATSQATFFVNNDIGDAAYLAAAYTFTLWQIAAFVEEKQWPRLLLVSAGIACVILIKNNFPETSLPRVTTDPVLTLLITFTPWTLFLILALLSLIKRLVIPEQDMVPKHELIALLAFLMPFGFSYFNPFRSTFDVYMAYPAGAAITSAFIMRTLNAETGSFSALLAYLHAVAGYAWLALLFCLVWFSFPANNYYGLIHFMALLSILTWMVFFSSIRNRLIIGCVVFAIGANLVLATYFYPNISNFRAGARLGIIARNEGIEEGTLFSYQAGSPYSLRFYSGANVIENNDFGRLVASKGCLVYMQQGFLGQFRAIRPDLKILGSSYDYPGRVWDMRFLNPDERAGVVNAKVLIRL